MSQTVNYKHCEGDGKNFSCAQQAMRTENYKDGDVDVHERHVEKRTTQCTTTNVPRPSGNPTAEAQALANQQKMAEQRSEQFHSQKEVVRDNLKSLEDQLASVESAAEKNAEKLAKLQYEHQKKEAKEKEKLDKAEQKVMKMASELSEKQQKALAEEAEKENALRAAEAEADRLAQQKLNLITQQREAAQMRIRELANKQAEARRKYEELKNRTQADTQAFNVQMTELKESEVTARKNAELIAQRQEQAQKELDRRQKELNELINRQRTQAEAANEKSQELAELQRRAAQLEREREEAARRAAEFQTLIGQEQAAVQRTAEQIRAAEAENRDTEFLLKKRVEERTTLEKVSKSHTQNEQEAARRAKELADKHGMDLKAAQEEIRKLMEAERRIAEERERTAANANRQPTAVAKGEQVTDIYQHAQIKTENATAIETEPHVTRSGSPVTQDSSKGIIGKITDAVGKIL